MTRFLAPEVCKEGRPGTLSAHEMTTGRVSHQQISPIKGQIVIYRHSVGLDSLLLSGKSQIMRAGPANTNRPRVRQFAPDLAKNFSGPVSFDSSNHNVVRRIIQAEWIAP